MDLVSGHPQAPEPSSNVFPACHVMALVRCWTQPDAVGTRFAYGFYVKAADPGIKQRPRWSFLGPLLHAFMGHPYPGGFEGSLAIRLAVATTYLFLFPWSAFPLPVHAQRCRSLHTNAQSNCLGLHLHQQPSAKCRRAPLAPGLPGRFGACFLFQSAMPVSIRGMVKGEGRVDDHKVPGLEGE